MKIEEMICVIIYEKEKVFNALMNVEDYIRFAEIRQMDAKMDMIKIMNSLGRTSGNRVEWVDRNLQHAGLYISARYCMDMRQLEDFLQGDFNENKDFKFDENRSSFECLKTLEVVGLRTNGELAYTSYDYEKQESNFAVGNIIHNFNNRDYRIMEKYTERNLLLMDVDSGAMVVGIGVDTFKRSPRYGIPSPEHVITGVEWGHGVYLPKQPSLVDFRALRQEYGYPRQIRDIQDYRQQCKEKFKIYHRLSKDDLLPDSIKEAATNAMYEEFGTGRPDTFDERLRDGHYDSNFIPPVQKERSR